MAANETPESTFRAARECVAQLELRATAARSALATARAAGEPAARVQALDDSLYFIELALDAETDTLAWLESKVA